MTVRSDDPIAPHNSPPAWDGLLVTISGKQAGTAFVKSASVRERLTSPLSCGLDRVRDEARKRDGTLKKERLYDHQCHNELWTTARD